VHRGDPFGDRVEPLAVGGDPSSFNTIYPQEVKWPNESTDRATSGFSAGTLQWRRRDDPVLIGRDRVIK